MGPIGAREKKVLPTFAKIEGNIRNLDGIAKYAQGWFGIFELPNMPGLSEPVKLLNKIIRGFIDVNKGTYGALSRADEWFANAKGKNVWDKGVIPLINQIFMSVVSVLDVFSLGQMITSGAKLGFAAKVVHSGAFFGGMTFTFAGYIQPLIKAHKDKAITEKKLAKWRGRVELYNLKKPEYDIEFKKKPYEAYQDAVKVYNGKEERINKKLIQYNIENAQNNLKHAQNNLKDAQEGLAVAKANLVAGKFQDAASISLPADEKLLKEAEDKVSAAEDKVSAAYEKCAACAIKLPHYQEAKRTENYSYLKAKATVKAEAWANKLTLAKNDVRGKWFDIAKTVAKAVQLIFALMILACGTVALPILIADAVTKLALGHFSMASMFNKEFRPDIDQVYLPKNLK